MGDTNTASSQGGVTSSTPNSFTSHAAALTACASRMTERRPDDDDDAPPTAAGSGCCPHAAPGPTAAVHAPVLCVHPPSPASRWLTVTLQPAVSSAADPPSPCNEGLRRTWGAAWLPPLLLELFAGGVHRGEEESSPVGSAVEVAPTTASRPIEIEMGLTAASFAVRPAPPSPAPDDDPAPACAPSPAPAPCSTAAGLSVGAGGSWCWIVMLTWEP